MIDQICRQPGRRLSLLPLSRLQTPNPPAAAAVAAADRGGGGGGSVVCVCEHVVCFFLIVALVCACACVCSAAWLSLPSLFQGLRCGMSSPPWH